jgi:hypothetical protein
MHPGNKAFEFSTEVGDVRVYPLRRLEDGDTFSVFGWSFSPVLSSGYIAWGLFGGGVHDTAEEAREAAQRWVKRVKAIEYASKPAVS